MYMPWTLALPTTGFCITANGKRPVGPFKSEVPIHAYIESITNRNPDGWLNVQIAARGFGSQGCHLLPHGRGRDLTVRGVSEDAAVLVLRKLGGSTQYAG